MQRPPFVPLASPTLPRAARAFVAAASATAALALGVAGCADSPTAPQDGAAQSAAGPSYSLGLARNADADTLVVGQTVQLTADLRAGRKSTATAWTSSNTGVATVSQSGLVTAVGAGSTTVTASNGTSSDAATIVVTAPPPAAIATPGPTGTPAAVLAFVAASNVPSVAATQAKGGVYAKYEAEFAGNAEYQWRTDSASFGANYYDRAMIYYVWWARTGNPTYLDRANKLAVNARAWVRSYNYDPPAFDLMLDGIALHALVTGDAESRATVARVADHYSTGYWFWVAGNPGEPDGDSRTSARVLNTILDAKLLGVQSPAGYDYGAKLRELMPRVLSTQSADGGYRWPNQCGHTKPFMTGMVNDALVRYYYAFEADNRIVTSVRKAVDFLWHVDWVPSAAAFRYLDADCENSSSGGGAGPTADLNNMIVGGFQFVARQTGDASYQTKADAVFAGGVYGAWLTGQKQFNQEYTTSYRFLAMRF